MTVSCSRITSRMPPEFLRDKRFKIYPKFQYQHMAYEDQLLNCLVFLLRKRRRFLRELETSLSHHLPPFLFSKTRPTEEMSQEQWRCRLPAILTSRTPDAYLGTRWNVKVYLPEKVILTKRCLLEPPRRTIMLWNRSCLHCGSHSQKGRGCNRRSAAEKGQEKLIEGTIRAKERCSLRVAEAVAGL